VKDVQNFIDTRNINIKKVGVKTVSYPISLRDRSRVRQHTIATANMYVNLQHNCKGTHMSRFVEVLNKYHGDFDTSRIPEILKAMKDHLGAEASHLDLTFPYFTTGVVPLCTEGGKDHPQKKYYCTLHGSLEKDADVRLTVQVPISFTFGSERAVSCRWGVADVAVAFRNFYWLEDIIALAEAGIDEATEAVQSSYEPKLTAELLCRAICSQLRPVRELRSHTVTVHNLSDACATFASARG